MKNRITGTPHPLQSNPSNRSYDLYSICNLSFKFVHHLICRSLHCIIFPLTFPLLLIGLSYVPQITIVKSFSILNYLQLRFWLALLPFLIKVLMGSFSNKKCLHQAIELSG